MRIKLSTPRGGRLSESYHTGMRDNLSRALRATLIIAAAALLSLACADGVPLAPDASPSSAPSPAPARAPSMLAQLPSAPPVQPAKAPPAAEMNRVIAKLRRATDRYHNLNVAMADGFVHLHDCEVRPGEGPVGIVYVHPGRLSDAVIDPALPEGLIYEPGENGRLRLVGAELVIPFALWPLPEPPRFLGATFQPEEEFGVHGLHVWIWRHNPNGLFAESNPNVRCAE